LTQKIKAIRKIHIVTGKVGMYRPGLTNRKMLFPSRPYLGLQRLLWWIAQLTTDLENR
jgi:hypothetical protein